MRQRVKASVVLAVLLMVGVMFGCASDPYAKAYQAIGTAGVCYDTGMKAVASAQAQNLITADQRAEINKYASIYFTAYNTAVDALAAAKTTGTAAASDKLSTALSGLSTALADLINNANKYAPLFTQPAGGAK